MSGFGDALRPVLPEDAGAAALVGRIWRPELGGPSVVAVRDGALVDITAAYPTVRDLCEADDPAGALRAARGEVVGPLDPVLANTPPETRDPARPWLLAPIDLQAIKAAGVTFVVSMIERVIEERARGDLAAAGAIRAEVNRLVGDDLARLRPGSAEAARLKQVLIAQGAWSQYLEVGIGADAEIFTKAQPMAAVGTGDGGRDPPGLGLEQPGAGGGAGGRLLRADRGREPGQRREPARRGGALGAAAGQGEGQQRLLRHRAVPAAVRCGDSGWTTSGVPPSR